MPTTGDVNAHLHWKNMLQEMSESIYTKMLIHFYVESLSIKALVGKTCQNNLVGIHLPSNCPFDI